MKTKLVHVRLGPGRITALCRKAKRRRVSFSKAVQAAVREFLEERREK